MPDPIVDPSLPVGDPAPQPVPDPAEPVAEPAAQPTPEPSPTELEGEDVDWRHQLAGEDEKLLKAAARYTSPKAVLEALVAAQTKIRSGGAKTPLKAGATPEELTAWREENGIPSEPTGYKVDLPDGLVLGEADKPLADAFMARMHAKNTPPEFVNEALGWYLAEQDRMIGLRDEADAAAKENAMESLREEYGPQFKRNVRAALELIPEGLRDSVLTSRMADGSQFGNNAAAVRWLAGVAMELNPASTVVSGSGINAVQAIETEIAGLKKMMGDRGSEYWKGPMAEKNQARFLELARAQERMK